MILNEIDPDRAQLAQLNFPESEVITGDIWEEKERIISSARARLAITGNDQLFLLSATPPCQGMSKNGIGSNLKAVRDGLRPESDPRNYLFSPALLILEALRPKFFFFENVDRMANAFVDDEEGKRTPLVQLLTRRLHALGYIGEFRQLNMANFGLPQNRLRMVGLFAEEKSANSLQIKVSVLTSILRNRATSETYSLRKAIGHLPPLDSALKETAKSSYHPLHKVPVSRPDLYYWIAHTEEGETAFNNNKCPKCSVTSTKDDLHCVSCQHLLPKPVVMADGNLRKIKGFISAYKRMRYDEPAPTITTRSAYAGSDHNLHPIQNRVLSILEVAIVQGLGENDYKWGPYKTINYGKSVIKSLANDTLIRDILGEPVPPVFSKVIGEHLVGLAKHTGDSSYPVEAGQLALL